MTKKDFTAATKAAPRKTAAATYAADNGAGSAAKETKTKRVQLLFKPTTWENVHKIATMRQTSANDLINNILDQYAKDNAETIAKYDSTF